MTKKELLERLERIKDSMDYDNDMLNRYEIEQIANDITELQWQINTQGIKE